MKGTKEGIEEEIDIDDPHLLDVVDEDQKEQLMDEIELLDGASAEFDQELVSRESSPRYLRICAHQFWCGDFPAALPHDDDAAASAYGRLRRNRSGQRGFLCVCL